MKLTKDEIDSLRSLKNSPGYAVLLKIEEDAKNKLANKLFESDFSNPSHLKVLEKNQIYMRARRDLFENIDSHSREIYVPDEVSS